MTRTIVRIVISSAVLMFAACSMNETEVVVVEPVVAPDASADEPSAIAKENCDVTGTDNGIGGTGCPVD